MIKKLDLGGTACFGSRNAVIVSIDGTTSDDYVTPLVIADYNRAPFADNTFEEAFGCCYFEDPFVLRELFRLLKPGAKAKLSACGSFEPDRYEVMFQTIATITKAAIKAGFEVRVEDRGGDNAIMSIDHPWFILTKPRRFKRGSKNT